jgi:hypothetical protein
VLLHLISRELAGRVLVYRLLATFVKHLKVIISNWTSDIGIVFRKYSKNWVGCTRLSSCSNMARSLDSLDADKTGMVEFIMAYLCTSWLGLLRIHSLPSLGARTVRISPVCATEKIPGILSIAVGHPKRMPS